MYPFVARSFIAVNLKISAYYCSKTKSFLHILEAMDSDDGLMIDESFDSSTAIEQPQSFDKEASSSVNETADACSVVVSSSEDYIRMLEEENSRLQEEVHRLRQAESAASSAKEADFSVDSRVKDLQDEVDRLRQLEDANLAREIEADALKGRVEDLEMQLRSQRIDAWKRETELCNVFRKCSEGLDAANEKIRHLTEEHNKQSDANNNDEGGGENLKETLAQKTIQCGALKEQLSAEKEKTAELTRKVSNV